MRERPEIDIDKLSTLARIQLNSEERESYSAQLSDILGFFQKLQQVDVEGIVPMSHPFEVEASLRNDIAGIPWDPARSLANAPATRDQQVVVPKVVEDA